MKKEKRMKVWAFEWEKCFGSLKRGVKQGYTFQRIELFQTKKDALEVSLEVSKENPKHIEIIAREI